MDRKECPLCWIEEHADNPGNPDQVERWKKRRATSKVAEDLSEKDAVSDALWDLRGEILKALKEIGEISPETMGSEVQGKIDYIIRRLVFLV